MKIKYLLILLPFIISNYFFSQNVNGDKIFSEIKELIKKNDPNTDIDNKLIFVSYWSPLDTEGREINKEMVKYQKIYKNATLKNGEKGLYFFNYCMQTDLVNFKIALKRDSLNPLGSFLKSPENNHSTQFVNSEIKNILYNSKGEIVQINTSKDTLFKLMLNQLTR